MAELIKAIEYISFECNASGRIACWRGQIQSGPIITTASWKVHQLPDIVELGGNPQICVMERVPVIATYLKIIQKKLLEIVIAKFPKIRVEFVDIKDRRQFIEKMFVGMDTTSYRAVKTLSVDCVRKLLQGQELKVDRDKHDLADALMHAVIVHEKL